MFPTPSKLRTRPFHGPLTTSVVLLLLGCGGAGEPETTAEEGPAPTSVETLRLVAQPFAEQYEAPGLAEPTEEITLSAEIAGRVEATGRDIGGRFQRGQVLIQLDDRAQKAQVTRLEAEIQRARTDLAWAERDLERQADLFEREIAAERARDDARRLVDTSRNQLAAREAELLVARVDLDRTRVLAPVTGTVARRHISVGEYVTPGTPLYDIVTTDAVRFVLGVSERDVIGLNAGDTIDVAIDALDTTRSGRVVGVSPSGSPGTRTYRVELTIRNPPGEPAVLPGMAGRARIVRREHEAVFLVPESALLRQGERSFLFLEVGGRAQRAEVEILSQTGTLAVLASELRRAQREGDEPIGAGSPLLTGGAASQELQAIILGQAAVRDGEAVDVRRVHDEPPIEEFS